MNIGAGPILLLYSLTTETVLVSTSVIDQQKAITGWKLVRVPESVDSDKDLYSLLLVHYIRFLSYSPDWIGTSAASSHRWYIPLVDYHRGWNCQGPALSLLSVTRATPILTAVIELHSFYHRVKIRLGSLNRHFKTLFRRVVLNKLTMVELHIGD